MQGIIVKTSYRNHWVILIFIEGKVLKTIAVLLLSLVLVNSALASIIGQMKGVFVCDTKDTYNQAVDMIGNKTGTPSIVWFCLADVRRLARETSSWRTLPA